MKSLFAKLNNPWKVWAARIFIAVVLFWNLQCAFYFIQTPQNFSSSFELVGFPGKIAIAGYGILFLMWQVPYFFAVLHPVKFKVSLIEAVIMQIIGTVAESALLTLIPDAFKVLRGSIIRFIVFDGVGVIFLLAAIYIVPKGKFSNQ